MCKAGRELSQKRLAAVVAVESLSTNGGMTLSMALLFLVVFVKYFGKKKHLISLPPPNYALLCAGLSGHTLIKCIKVCGCTMTNCEIVQESRTLQLGTVCYPKRHTTNKKINLRQILSDDHILIFHLLISPAKQCHFSCCLPGAHLWRAEKGAGLNSGKKWNPAAKAAKRIQCGFWETSKHYCTFNNCFSIF